MIVGMYLIAAVAGFGWGVGLRSKLTIFLLLAAFGTGIWLLDVVLFLNRPLHHGEGVIVGGISGFSIWIGGIAAGIAWWLTPHLPLFKRPASRDNVSGAGE